VTLLPAALLGIIQGLTEFLPVSSTAHLLIVERILAYQDPGGVFTVIIQFGSILALMWLYRTKLVAVVRALPTDPDARRFARMLLVAFLPAAVAGAVLEPFVKRVLYTSPGVIAVAFVAGGLVMLAAERFRPAPVVENAEHTPIGRAFGIGLCQMVALVPGVSRSGATIVGGLLLGLDRAAAAEFSFFLAMPTLGGAFAHDAWEVRHDLSAARSADIAVGFALAFVAALVVVRPFLRYVARRGFAPFAWYRIIAGVLLGALLLAGALRPV
jgi:undecaprenyl-diphosphatase